MRFIGILDWRDLIFCRGVRTIIFLIFGWDFVCFCNLGETTIWVRYNVDIISINFVVKLLISLEYGFITNEFENDECGLFTSLILCHE